jgi:predicted RND superfamily exporter protein
MSLQPKLNEDRIKKLSQNPLFIVFYLLILTIVFLTGLYYLFKGQSIEKRLFIPKQDQSIKNYFLPENK